MTVERVPIDEVRWHPGSVGDGAGRLFTWNGRLLRGLRGEAAVLHARLLEDGTMQHLVDLGLVVPTRRADLSLVGYSLVLEHERLWPVTFAVEWCPEMLRDAGIAVLRLQIELALVGCQLHDAHPWNVVFDGLQPRFVDVGSFEVASDHSGWPASEEFIRFFLNPLRLFAQGEHRMARLLLRDFMLGATSRDARLLRGSVIQAVGVRALRALGRTSLMDRELARRGQRLIGAVTRRAVGSTIGRPRTMMSEIERLDLRHGRSVWGGYYGDEFPDLLDRSDWNDKHRTVASALQMIKPSSVVDVASNRGWFAQLAATTGADVIAFDIDEPSVSALYEDARSRQLRVIPLVIDITRPTPGEGLLNAHLPAASSRLSGEMVIGLAVLHHLCYWQRVPLELAISAITQFGRDSAIIEFIDPSDKYVAEWRLPAPSGYTLDAARSQLTAMFSTVGEHPSNMPNRTIFVCQGKRE